MEYRLVETVEPRPESLASVIELRRYDDAYAAVARMKRAYLEGDRRVERWYLLDDFDRVLFGPDDLRELDELAAA